MKQLEKAKENFLKQEQTYSKYATKSTDAIRIKDEEEDMRAPFFRDVDRIIHALSYNCYADKTQVFSFKANDYISHRMVHVQLVSKIARTLGRGLGLNTDLIEAIALGHDIGHTPLGHTGEMLLDEITQRELNESFAHNIQSVRHYLTIENGGEGLNLTIQVLDGIMCHNSKMVSNEYIPEKKDKESFLNQYNLAYLDLGSSKIFRPMTLEGCVVRISDIIAYIGRDIEDAIKLGRLKRSDLPKDVTNILGSTNSEIINTIVTDIIDNSIDKPYIKMSKDVHKALFKLKDFNTENIYNKSLTKEEIAYYREGMNKIYNSYLKAIETNDKSNIIYSLFLNNKSQNYLSQTSSKRMVVDFIAGMTDAMFLSEIKNLM